MKPKKENLLELLYGKQPPGLPKSSKVPNGHQEVFSSTANAFFFSLHYIYKIKNLSYGLLER